MFLKTLYLCNFRNYEETEVHFSPGLNVFYGDNAQGKTNLLEAIYLIATGRSFRTARLQELIYSKQSFFCLKANIVRDNFEHTVQITFDGHTKKLNLDGSCYATLQHLLGLLPSVFHTPSNIELIDGPPSVRRQFLNIHLAQKDPLYIHYFTRYWRAMKQRNALLRLQDTSAIECWEIEMAEAASFLFKARDLFLKELRDPFKTNGLFLSSDQEEHTIRFHPSAPSSTESYLAQLYKNRSREKQLGFTLTGPHRDDFGLWINDKASHAFASEGQKKTSIFSLRLAEWELFTKSTNAPALLGIDDFGVHLDPTRLSLFNHSLSRLGQVFITLPCSDKHLSAGKYFLISSGSISGYRDLKFY